MRGAQTPEKGGRMEFSIFSVFLSMWSSRTQKTRAPQPFCDTQKGLRYFYLFCPLECLEPGSFSARDKSR